MKITLKPSVNSNHHLKIKPYCYMTILGLDYLHLWFEEKLTYSNDIYKLMHFYNQTANASHSYNQRITILKI